MLEKGGYAVTTATNGEDALAQAKATRTDLVITDYHMPGMSGVELIKALRGLGNFRFCPILVLTTESQQGKRDDAKAAGATGWLVKPVAADQLYGVLKQLLPA